MWRTVSKESNAFDIVTDIFMPIIKSEKAQLLGHYKVVERKMCPLLCNNACYIFVVPLPFE